MAKAHVARASEIEYDGTTPPHVLHSSRMTNAAALVTGTTHVAESDLYIVKVGVYIDTAFTHASSKLNIGSVADDDAFLDGMVTYNIGTGYFEFDPADYLGATGRTIPKGTAFWFTMDSADTTGKLSAYMIVRPANA